MLNLKRLTVILLISSCATMSSAWVEESPAKENRSWRFCSKELDGIELDKKGFCYITKECRKKLWWYDCRKKQYYCAWGDIDCMQVNDLLGRKIVREQ